MAEPITLKGIQRNASKLAVEDGRAEDLINLRFKDGSWRTSGDGMQVFEMTTGNMYEQLYIHTNSPYRHLLGVKEVSGVRKLYWFANISDDAVTVTPLDTPEEICTVANGDLYITQTGHLLAIIDSADDFEYVIFKTGEEKYHVMDVDSNSAQDSRSLYPFGQVHFNFYSKYADDYIETISSPSPGVLGEPAFPVGDTDIAIAKLKERNKFIYPIFVICAIKLYDGSYIYSCNPILVFPNDMETLKKSANIMGVEKILPTNDKVYEWLESQEHDSPVSAGGGSLNYYVNNAIIYKDIDIETDDNILSHDFQGHQPGKHILKNNSNNNIVEYNGIGFQPLQCVMYRNNGGTALYNRRTSFARGYDLVMSIDNDAIIRNSDIFKGVSIFVTTQISPYIYDSVESSFYRDSMKMCNIKWKHTYCWNNGIQDTMQTYNFDYNVASVSPQNKSNEEIIHELTQSPFFLLREYSINELSSLRDNPIVDLSGPKYAGLLENIVNQEKLKYESQGRTTYIPHVSYNYNGRLHIADYTSIQFHGYPLDCFHLHNHSLKYEEGVSFKGLLPNLASNNDEYLQFPKTEYPLDQQASDNIAAVVRVALDTQQGEQVVCRYISNYDYLSPTNWIESLNPLLTFPDIRAKKMEILFAPFDDQGGYYICEYGLSVELKPHPYLNMAYAISSDLKPIKFESDYEFMSGTIDVEDFVKEVNNNERFSNGLKVSLTNNPFFFPVEQAYQIGQGRIIAMCSNAIAVGTGQTGAAPLYVFCTDGIYALYVDSSGEMAYTNARIIARDVCNNAKSVTPIDTGVVFTTDRGLMEIAGDVVNEIGQPAEGDVVDYTEPDWAKPRNVGKNILTKVANLPLNLVDGVDFLSYLRGAIINYNHNERELMVSNPDYPYSYVLDRYSNWSRRDYSADEYVNNYPTSYRVKDGVFYKVDAEQDGLEGKSEAPNDFLYLSNVIKLGSVDFKKAYRFVVRGKFNTNNGTENKVLGVYVFGSYDGRQFAMLGANEKKGTFTDIGCKVERTDVKYFRVGLAGYLSGDSRIDFMEIEGEQSNLTTKLR